MAKKSTKTQWTMADIKDDAKAILAVLTDTAKLPKSYYMQAQVIAMNADFHGLANKYLVVTGDRKLANKIHDTIGYEVVVQPVENESAAIELLNEVLAL